MAKNYDEVAGQILDLVGGKGNVTRFTHCVTRLRFTIKDRSLINEADLAKVPGVVGMQWLGEQYQVIVGTECEDYYNAVCRAGGFETTAAIDENLDSGKPVKKGFSFKKIGAAILGYLSPTMTGIIPMMIAACMCKTLAAILGPDMLGVISATGDFYIVLNFMYNAFFYFIPLFLGYSAAKTLNMNPIYGIYLGALIIVPDFLNLVGVRETISIFGISAPVANYSASFLPVILGAVIMHYLVKGLNKVIPNVLKPVFVPTLAILVMAPVMFVVCAPLGAYIGNVVGNFFIALSEANIVLRTLGAILLAVLLPYMVLCGMHGALVNFAILTFVTNGSEAFLLPIMMAYNFAVFGVTLGAVFKLRKPENKTAAIGYFVSGILGSVTEPCLYGIIMKYRQTMKALLGASVVIGLIIGILSPVYYVITSATAYTFWIPWVQGGTLNTVYGVGLMLVALLAGFVATLPIKFTEE